MQRTFTHPMTMPMARKQDDDTGTDTPYVETVHRLLNDRLSRVNDNSSSDDPGHEFLGTHSEV